MPDEYRRRLDFRLDDLSRPKCGESSSFRLSMGAGQDRCFRIESTDATDRQGGRFDFGQGQNDQRRVRRSSLCEQYAMGGIAIQTGSALDL
jgi:hypothetical protein